MEYSLYFTKNGRCREKFFKSLGDMISYICRYCGNVKDYFRASNGKNKFILEYENKDTQRPDFMIFYTEEKCD